MREIRVLNATPEPLPLPDGRDARDVTVHELNRELIALRIPGVSHETGKQESLHLYSEHKAKAMAEYGARWVPGEASDKGMRV